MIPENEIAELTQKVKHLESRLAEEQRVGRRLQEMVKSLKARNGYLLTLNDLTSGLINRTDLDQLLRTIVGHACTLAKTDHGFMHLVLEESGELELKIGVGEFKKAVGMRVGPDTGMTGIAMSTQEAFWVKDYKTWDGRVDAKAFDRLRACIVLPLKNRTGTIGLGRFGNDTLRFSMTEVSMLRRFSHMASICIENAKLYRDLERELGQRKLAEKTLQLNEEAFFSIFDSIRVGFYRTDNQGRVLIANTVAAKMLGYTTSEEASGLSMPDLYKAIEDRERLMKEIFATGSVSAYEVEMKKKDGRIISVLINAHARHNEAGEFIGTQGTVVDITQRKKKETESVHSQKLEAIGSLAAGIAHEINTPIQYVSDNTNFLREAFEDLKIVLEAGTQMWESVSQNQDAAAAGHAYATALEDADMAYLQDEIPQAIAQSMDGLSRVSRIVRSMKAFSHAGSEPGQVADINDMLENTLTVARNEWKYVANIRKEMQKDLPRISCNPGELSQVFLNMIVNASHAIEERIKQDRGGKEEKGTITVTTQAVPNGIEVRIADTGSGIPASAREQIFNPFFTTKTVGKGSGQGLAIAHSVVVDRHGGKISFTTRTGHGTTFIIELPGTHEEEHPD
ncbi:MAG: ATP-binding protein [Desulfobacter sp.]